MRYSSSRCALLPHGCRIEVRACRRRVIAIIYTARQVEQNFVSGSGKGRLPVLSITPSAMFAATVSVALVRNGAVRSDPQLLRIINTSQEDAFSAIGSPIQGGKFPCDRARSWSEHG